MIDWRDFLQTSLLTIALGFMPFATILILRSY